MSSCFGWIGEENDILIDVFVWIIASRQWQDDSVYGNSDLLGENNRVNGWSNVLAIGEKYEWKCLFVWRREKC